MTLWVWLPVALGVAASAAFLTALRLRSFRLPPMASRVLALPWRRKVALVGLILKDPRVPVPAKVALPALALYLALPIDLIPDFIPVVGHLDDALLLALAARLLLGAIPPEALGEHLGELERDRAARNEPPREA